MQKSIENYDPYDCFVKVHEFVDVFECDLMFTAENHAKTSNITMLLQKKIVFYSFRFNGDAQSVTQKTCVIMAHERGNYS